MRLLPLVFKLAAASVTLLPRKAANTCVPYQLLRNKCSSLYIGVRSLDETLKTG